MADSKSIKEIVEQAIIDLIQDGKLEIQDENGDKIEDLSLGVAAEEDYEDNDDENFEDDSDEEDEE